MSMFHGEDLEPRDANAPEPVEAYTGLSRRDLLKNAAGAVLAAAGAGLAGVLGDRREAAAQIPLPRPICRVPFLDRKQYVHSMEIHAHLPELINDKMQLWASGERRFLFQYGNVIDITDPRKPAVVNKGGFATGRNIQLAYVQHLKKWILIVEAAPPITFPTPEFPRGKYSVGAEGGRPGGQNIAGLSLVDRSVNFKGLRGIRVYDATDPMKIVLLQEFSTGQKGDGTHRNYYDGGKYAYLDTAPDETFVVLDSSERVYSNGLMIVDLTDPANIKEVSRWWIPGQRLGEEAEYRKWRNAGDLASYVALHGPVCVPKRVEDGGNVGYGGWGHWGMLIHDFTDITKPKIWGRVDPIDPPGGIPFHTCHPLITDPAEKRNQNIVFTTSEPLETDCGDPYLHNYVINVADRRNPRIIGRFPRPVPPPDAPYPDFCCARGRFGAHDVQHFKAPGTPPYNFVAMTWFVAGLRIYDIADPTDPKETAYFVPTHPGELANWNSWRTGGASNVLVEYDRNLIWCATNSGLYCMSTSLLGNPALEPRKVTKWSPPHFNIGHDDQVRRSVYFGRSLSQMA